MEKKKLLFATGTNSYLSDDRIILMKSRIFGLFKDDIRFTTLTKTAPIGMESPEFTNCVGIAYTTLPLATIKDEFKGIEHDGKRYHEKDWNRDYIINMLNEAECLKHELL